MLKRPLPTADKRPMLYSEYLPTSAIERQEMDFRPEVRTVSDEVAKNMDFSQCVDATAFRFGKSNDDTSPVVLLTNGHHRMAAALQTDRPYLAVSVKAINAKGEKINALIALSKQIEKMLAESKPASVTDQPTRDQVAPKGRSR